MEERDRSEGQRVAQELRRLQRSWRGEEPKREEKRGIRKWRAQADRIRGLIPYNGRMQWGIRNWRVRGEEWQIGIPYIQAEAISLDFIWQVRVSRENGRIRWEARTPWTSRPQLERIEIRWTPEEGWTAVDPATGWRSRPVPRLMAGIACISMVWVYPELLQLMLEGAKSSQEPMRVYGLSLIGTMVMVGLVAWALWLAHRAEPSGLVHMLKGLGNMLQASTAGQGTERKEAANETEEETNQTPAAIQAEQVKEATANDPEGQEAEAGGETVTERTREAQRARRGQT